MLEVGIIWPAQSNRQCLGMYAERSITHKYGEEKNYG
jgi:hypothetical protein